MSFVNKKVSELPLASTINDNDLILISTESSGNYTSKSITYGEVIAKLIADNSTSGSITQSITNNNVDQAPSSDAVYDALLLKANTSDLTGFIVQTITNGDTTHASSSDAVYDALLLKADTSSLSNYMLKSTYDNDNNGTVDNSTNLNGQAASYYQNRTNHTGTQGISTITMNTNKLLGRSTGGSGAVEEVTVSTGLTYSGGILSANNSMTLIAETTIGNNGSADLDLIITDAPTLTKIDSFKHIRVELSNISATNDTYPTLVNVFAKISNPTTNYIGSWYGMNGANGDLSTAATYTVNNGAATNSNLDGGDNVISVNQCFYFDILAGNDVYGIINPNLGNNGTGSTSDYRLTSGLPSVASGNPAVAGITAVSTYTSAVYPVDTISFTNITLSGLQTINGYTVKVNDRVLVTGQTTGTQDGIYKVASGSWTRTSDATNGTVLSDKEVYIKDGTHTGQYWKINSPVTVNTNSITATQTGEKLIFAGIHVDLLNSSNAYDADFKRNSTIKIYGY